MTVQSPSNRFPVDPASKISKNFEKKNKKKTSEIIREATEIYRRQQKTQKIVDSKRMVNKFKNGKNNKNGISIRHETT